MMLLMMALPLLLRDVTLRYTLPPCHAIWRMIYARPTAFSTIVTPYRRHVDLPLPITRCLPLR